MTTIELYKNDLRIYGHKKLPRGYRPKSFHERVDGSLLLLCRQCPNLNTLVSVTIECLLNSVINNEVK